MTPDQGGGVRLCRALEPTLSIRLEIIVILLVGKRHLGGLVHLGSVLLHKLLIDNGGGGSEGGSSNELLGTQLDIILRKEAGGGRE